MLRTGPGGTGSTRWEDPIDVTRKCPNCSAILKRANERFCGFCGTEVPLPASSSAPPSPFGDVPARFAALADHLDRAKAERRRPDDSWIGSALTFRMVFGVFFAAIGLFIGLTFVATLVMAPFSLVPFGFTALGIWIVIDAIRRRRRYAAAPLRRVPALVTGERTQVTGGGRNSSARTTYFVTLEDEDGRRREYRTKGSVVGEVSEGDMGIAHVREVYLLGFDRLPV